VIYKQEQRLPRALVHSVPWKAAKWFFGHYQLSTLSNAFFTLKWAHFSVFWRAVHWGPHIGGAAVCLLGALVPAPRPERRGEPDAAKPVDTASDTEHKKAA